MEAGKTRRRTDTGVGGQSGAGEQIHADGQTLQDGHRYFRMDTGTGGQTQALEDGHSRWRSETGTGGRTLAFEDGEWYFITKTGVAGRT